MIKSYKYKIKPTKIQSNQLDQFFGCARFIYNWGLDKKINSWKNEQKSLSYNDLAKQLTSLKKEDRYIWLNECIAESLQQSLRNLDSAYNGFFKSKKGFPKFKSKHKSKDSVKFIHCIHFDFENWKVKLPKIGWVKLCKNQTFDQSLVRQGTTTVHKDKCGAYWVSIIIDDKKELPPKTKVEEQSTVGIDLGIKDFIVLSDGTKVSNPKYYECSMRKLKRIQQSLSRKVKDSHNYQKTRVKLNKCYRYITNQKLDMFHKLSSYLINNYDTICMEDLNVEGMMQNHNLALSIQSASWSMFKEILSYKSDWYGKNLITIGRYEPSSKTCHCCGYKNNDLKLSDRTWVCPVCDSVLDRDINAAINIKKIGLNQSKEIKLPRVGGSPDCGEFLR
jgi:putative transposase